MENRSTLRPDYNLIRLKITLIKTSIEEPDGLRLVNIC